MTNTTTITKTFSVSDLPRWAQNDPAVAAKCERDYAYRCMVYTATTAQYRNFLKREAQRDAKRKRRI